MFLYSCGLLVQENVSNFYIYQIVQTANVKCTQADWTISTVLVHYSIFFAILNSV